MYELIFGEESCGSVEEPEHISAKQNSNLSELSWLPEKCQNPLAQCDESHDIFVKEELKIVNDNSDYGLITASLNKSRDNSCTLCLASNMTLSELKEHVAVHTDKDPLSGCQSSEESIVYPHFSMFQHITCHNKSEGSSSKVYSCLLCGKSNIYLTDVSRHVNKECSNANIFENRPTKHSHKLSKINIRNLKKSQVNKVALGVTCEICHHEYMDQNDYTQHMKLHDSKDIIVQKCASKEDITHNVQNITCNICLRSYSKLDDYKQHVVIHENKLQHKFICVTCGKTYLKQSSLEAHMVCHAVEPADCQYCGKTFKNKMMLNTHMMLHTKTHPFQCPKCSNGYVVEASLKKHLLKDHNVKGSGFQCIICGKLLTSKLRLRIHQNTHGYKINRSIESSHLCSYCGVCFKWKSNLSTHEKLVHRKEFKGYVCSVCGKLFKSTTAHRYHMANHEGIEKYICDVCGLGFCTPRNLRIHKFCHSDVRAFACKFCNATFKHHRNLQHHKRSVHGSVPKGGKERHSYSCGICKKSFSSEQYQLEHMRIHNNVQPFQCKICGESFSHYQGLFQHKRSGHTKIPQMEESNIKEEEDNSNVLNMEELLQFKPVDHSIVSDVEGSEVRKKEQLVCSQCNVSFADKKYLKEHMKRKHGQFMEERKQNTRLKAPITCKLCGCDFLSSKSFIDHSKNVHRIVGEYLFSCKHANCNKCYKNLIGLRQHEWRYHGGAKKKMFPCPICSKTFTTKSGRDIHTNIHTGEMSFTCESCGKSFRLKSSLVEHSLTHTDLKPVTCGVCEKSFRKRSHLVTHMRTHTGEKPYACNICGRSFAQAGDRNKHQTNIHPAIQSNDDLFI